MSHKQRKQPHRKAVSRRRSLVLYMGAVIAISTAAFLWIGAAFSGPEQGSGAAQSFAPNGLQAPVAFYDFGTVSMKDGKVQHRFAVRNTADAPVRIEKLYTSCMCTEATLLAGPDSFGPFGMPGHGYLPSVDRVVAPGEEVTVEAEFDPNAHGPAGVGRNDRAVYLQTGPRSGLELRFTVYVTP